MNLPLVPASNFPTTGDQDMRKQTRHIQLMQVLEEEDISTQQDIIELFNQRGINISQSTLSKDLKELGVVKVRDAEGNFKLVKTKEKESFHTGVMLKRELVNFLTEMIPVNNLVLLKTAPGNASGLSKYVDEIGWPEVAGTLASVDTVLVVTCSDENAAAVISRLNDIMNEL